MHAAHLQAAQAASKAEASAVAAASQARKARTQGALAAANKAAQSYNQVCCKAGRLPICANNVILLMLTCTDHLI